MKKLCFILLMLCFGSIVNAQILNIPQPLKGYLLQCNSTTFKRASYSYPFGSSYNAVDANNDGEIDTGEAALVQSLSIGSDSGVHSLNGLEHFVNLKQLACGELTDFQASYFPNLKMLSLSHSSMTSLNLTGLTNLEELFIGYNPLLSGLDITGLTSLISANVSNNPLLASLSCNELDHLEYLEITNNVSLAGSFDFASMLNLKKIVFSGNNQFTDSLNFSGLPQLKIINCQQNQQLGSLVLNDLPLLTGLYCQSNALSSLSINVGGLPNIEELYCYGNNLATLDVSAMPQLKRLLCGENAITSLNLGGSNHIINLFCQTNNLTTLDTSQLSDLISLDCSNNQLNALNLSGNTNIQLVNCKNNAIDLLDLNGLAGLIDLDCSFNTIGSLNLSGLQRLVKLVCSSNPLHQLLTATELHNF